MSCTSPRPTQASPSTSSACRSSPRRRCSRTVAVAAAAGAVVGALLGQVATHKAQQSDGGRCDDKAPVRAFLHWTRAFPREEPGIHPLDTLSRSTPQSVADPCHLFQSLDTGVACLVDAFLPPPPPSPLLEQLLQWLQCDRMSSSLLPRGINTGPLTRGHRY
mmetsp:Transcript_8462/g.21853  ORF Transcript_8462/g.21853 Transcript_8462/m.21853 type:complete len:162 (-) Transcript_8462:162-647(-)